MKITVELNSIDELSELQKIYIAGNNIVEDFIKEEVNKQLGTSEKEPKATQEEASEPKKGKKAGTKQPVNVEKEPENGTNEAESRTKEAESGTEPKEDIGDLTVKARKALAKVNKQTKENTAKEWISEKGYDSLADIDDAGTLKELIDKAEEFLNA